MALLKIHYLVRLTGCQFPWFKDSCEMSCISRWHTQFAEVESHVIGSFLEGKCSTSIVSLSLVAQNPCCLIRFTVIAATTFQDKEGQIHRSLAETLIVLLEHSHHHLSSDAAKTRRDSHGAAAESRQRSGQSHESQVCCFATS
jgi:hypothetical protein